MRNIFNIFNQNELQKQEFSRAPLQDYSDALLKAFSFDQDCLTEIKEEVWRDIKLTKKLCERIDLYKSTDSFFSKAFYDTLNLSDTKIKIFDENKEIDIKEIIKFFPVCYSAQDVSRFILDRLLSYGLFACQLYVEDEINSLIIPAPWAFSWEKISHKPGSGLPVEEWVLKFDGNGGMRCVDREFVVYQPLDQVFSGGGIHPVPPFKCALEPLAYYKHYQIALRAILGKFGLHKQVYAKINAGEFVSLFGQSVNSYSDMLESVIDDLAKNVQKSREGGILYLPPATEMQNVDAVEIPEAITKMDALLSDAVFRGLKTTPALMGRSETNQTTLSTVQKQIKLNEITSYQQKADSAFKVLIEKFFIYSNIKFTNIRIEREKTVLDTIENEVKAQQIITDENKI